MAATSTLRVQCPECDQVIPITVQAELARSQDDQLEVGMEPDLSEVTLYAWPHANP
ncbi:hypothetical protein ACPB9J_33625 [Streptomyces lavendulocolor]|uniref:hypothetical protein n=1 Tax=Streptomyces lavendulocolor TaxID=67316 RepID=UPI003C300C60